jgi:hypothetical protein
MMSVSNLHRRDYDPHTACMSAPFPDAPPTIETADVLFVASGLVRLTSWLLPKLSGALRLSVDMVVRIASARREL